MKPLPGIFWCKTGTETFEEFLAKKKRVCQLTLSAQETETLRILANSATYLDSFSEEETKLLQSLSRQVLGG